MDLDRRQQGRWEAFVRASEVMRKPCPAGLLIFLQCLLQTHWPVSAVLFLQ